MSSESDSEDLQRFKDCLDTAFLNDNLLQLSDCNKVTTGLKDPERPSLRRNVHEEDESLNFFHVTPQFQEYVAKHLSGKLDRVLKESLNHTVKTAAPKSRKCKGGIKLLQSSEFFLKHERTTGKQMKVIPVKDKGKDNSKKLQEMCRLVAVEAKDILKGKDIQFWSNRSKSEVFKYIKLNTGVLEYQEKPFSSI